MIPKNKVFILGVSLSSVALSEVEEIRVSRVNDGHDTGKKHKVNN